ncbi:Rz1-like lysis system protein LysC [Shewanella xiamenensis]|uniref:Rz1-like lysis system protein LysC n=2 Tax=Shewanella xiamenensis TaxID=332186 RepID=UPI0036F39829|nr:Rz1-like lysis system protein LysC [Shewanella xiamenensis]
MKLINRGLLLLCLMSLIGCSSSVPIVRTVTTTKTVYVLPPQQLMSECNIPQYTGRTNPDLYNYSLTLIAALERCNTDWQALHDWREAKANEQPNR